MRRILVPLAFSLIFVVAGCGGDEDPAVEVPTDAGSTTTDSTGSTASTASSTSTTVDEAEEDDAGGPFTTGPAEHTSGDYGHLTAVRHADHDGYYRVVFEFRDGVPGTKVGFTERPVIQDGSGNEIDVAGDRVVLVEFEPASSYDLEANKPTYSGPNRLEVEQRPITEIVKVSDFEASLDWAIGVDDKTEFRLTTLDGPPRVVIDFRADS